jgi:hypothetical protein
MLLTMVVAKHLVVVDALPPNDVVTVTHSPRNLLVLDLFLLDNFCLTDKLAFASIFVVVNLLCIAIFLLQLSY